MRQASLAGVLLTLSCLGAMGCRSAQPEPSLQAAQEAGPTGALVPTATFREAVSLSTDAAGRLYVVDAAAATVTIFEADGRRIATHGGPGSGDYGFFEPADLDPTNGLALFVADLGNRRVQRFDRDFRLVRSIPVELPADDGLRDAVDAAGPGEPRAVASSPTGDLHLIDARTRTVLTLDNDRRFERSLGRLRDPVDLAVADDGTLFVADRGRAEVVVYDPFGFRLRALDLDMAPEAITFVQGRLLVTTANDVRVATPEGDVRATYPVALAAPLKGAAIAGGQVWVLTATGLFSLSEAAAPSR